MLHMIPDDMEQVEEKLRLDETKRLRTNHQTRRHQRHDQGRRARHAGYGA